MKKLIFNKLTSVPIKRLLVIFISNILFYSSSIGQSLPVSNISHYFKWEKVFSKTEQNNIWIFRRVEITGDDHKHLTSDVNHTARLSPELVFNLNVGKDAFEFDLVNKIDFTNLNSCPLKIYLQKAGERTLLIPDILNNHYKVSWSNLSGEAVSIVILPVNSNDFIGNAIKLYE
jgi:hypothetical protein